MDTLMWRVTFVRGSENFWLDDIALREAELADEWQSWQAQGRDQHSIVADPLFVDPAHDNYQLQPQSPALQLGFEPIPFEKSDRTRMSCGLRGRSWRCKACGRHWPDVELPFQEQNPVSGVVVDYENRRDWLVSPQGGMPHCRHYTFKLGVLVYAIRLVGMDQEVPLRE